MSITVQQEERFLKIGELAYKLKDLPYRLKDLKATVFSLDWVDTIDIGINPATYNTFIRTFDIDIDIDSTLVKDMENIIPININASLLKVSNAGNVIGDIRFYSKALNETNWDETITPFGYGKWKQMITGDYIYEKALCKYVMQASLNADRPNTREYKHKVDVPDVTDRGTIVLTTDNQPYEVHFTSDRLFHIVPEVNVSLKSYSGVDKTPIIIPYDITRTGFKVAMKVDGEFVEGSITYAARGY